MLGSPLNIGPLFGIHTLLKMRFAFGLHLQINTAQIWVVNKNVASIVGLEFEILGGVLREPSS